MQTTFDFLSAVVLRDHSKWRANKNEHGKGKMLIRTLFLKVINNERKILTHHEIIDCIAEQIVQTIKTVDSSELKAAKSLIYSVTQLVYSFKFTYVLQIYGP